MDWSGTNNKPRTKVFGRVRSALRAARSGGGAVLGGAASLGIDVHGERGADSVLWSDGGHPGPEHRPHGTLGGE